MIERAPNPAPRQRGLAGCAGARVRPLGPAGPTRWRRKERRRAGLEAHLAALRRDAIHRLHHQASHDPRPDRRGGARRRDAGPEGAFRSKARHPGLSDATLAEVRLRLRDQTDWGKAIGTGPDGVFGTALSRWRPIGALPDPKRAIAVAASRPSAGPSVRRAISTMATPRINPVRRASHEARREPLRGEPGGQPREGCRPTGRSLPQRQRVTRPDVAPSPRSGPPPERASGRVL